MTTAIVTDSTADFAGINPDDLGIQVVPLTVNWGRDVLRDKIDVTTEEFYERLRHDRDLPKTAAPPVGIFEDLYRSLLSEHEAVISIHIASKLSATYEVATSAARSVAPDRIHVVDSRSVSVGVGWLAAQAAMVSTQPAPPAVVVKEIEDMAGRIRLYLTLDTLEYLQRGGRIGRASAFLGGLLNVKPVLQVLDGEIHPVERVRTRAASVRRVAELASQLGPKDLTAVVHGDCRSEAESLVTLISEQERVPITEIGSVVGTHAGPGVLGIGCVLAR
ncbi:MAG: DegV family protein [Chloroflexi bacterium]|nr:DegV family protein [Chloroflexota bacterium]